MKTKDNDVTRRCRRQLLAILVFTISIAITCFITSKSPASSYYEQKQNNGLLQKESQSLQHRNCWCDFYITIGPTPLSVFAVEELPEPLVEEDKSTLIKDSIEQTETLSNDGTPTLEEVTVEESEEVSILEEVTAEESEETPTLEEITVEESDAENIVEEANIENSMEEIASDSSEWNGEILNSYNGVVDGPSGKETYYNLDMSGVINIMRNEEGIYYEYWIRDDGVKMYGDYVMCAADLSIRPKGTILQTSLGMGIVCDTGNFAATDPYKLDIAVNW